MRLSDGSAPVGTTSNPLHGHVSIQDGANLDAFSRLRVSTNVTLFDVQCQYDAEPLKMEAFASGTGVARFAARHSAHRPDTVDPSA